MPITIERTKERHKNDTSLYSIFIQSQSPCDVNLTDVLTELSCSSPSDLAARRGVFSRRHYGSVEMLASVDQVGSDHFRLFRKENGERAEKDERLFKVRVDSPVSGVLFIMTAFGFEANIFSRFCFSFFSCTDPPSTPFLENPEYQTRWYFKYFLGKLHQNYVGADSEKLPFFLSVVLTDANTQGLQQYRAILWRKTGAQKICLSHNPSKPLTVKSILSNFQSMERLEKGPKEIFAPEIQKDLLLLEEQEGSVNFKFGVIYAKVGQLSDDEMFSNEGGSWEFDQFLSLLGDRIRLKGWDKYRGGLDVKGDMTGKYSVHTVYEGHEIMFHVSTLLPFSKDNRQQVERKRHVGNDIVNIIFLDGSHEDHGSFKPSMIKSQFTHIFALVTYQKDDCSFRLSVFSDESVPLFGPTLPCPPIFYTTAEFREFLLVKLMNGEKAAFNTPTFAQKRERTLDMLIKDMYADHLVDTRGQLKNSQIIQNGSKVTGIKDGSKVTGVKDGSKITGINDGIKVTSIKDGSKVTRIKDGSKVTGIKDGSKVTGIKDGSKVTGIKYEGKVTGVKDGSKFTSINDGIKVTSIKDGSKVTRIKDGRNVTGIKDGSKVTGIKDGSKVTGVKDGSKVTGIKDESKVTGVKDRSKVVGIKKGVKLQV
ncbi:GTPase-activating Rap/Ran-GAP domain-like protein 3 [Tachypleus tridentatus]|uniref:GTPase-activating Rap/Ran-GAP domain-like protein 3 n=1 Tax=Tachypleus tridentatus TaxID=6853 RepID=UPI003FD63839